MPHVPVGAVTSASDEPARRSGPGMPIPAWVPNSNPVQNASGAFIAASWARYTSITAPSPGVPVDVVNVAVVLKRPLPVNNLVGDGDALPSHPGRVEVLPLGEPFV